MNRWWLRDGGIIIRRTLKDDEAAMMSAKAWQINNTDGSKEVVMELHEGWISNDNARLVALQYPNEWPSMLMWESEVRAYASALGVPIPNVPTQRLFNCISDKSDDERDR